MVTFAPTASAAEMYGPNGETVSGSESFELSSGDFIYIDYWITCNNGWFDGTNGSDYVEAGIFSSVVVTGSASVDATATYIYDGEYTSESDSASASMLGPGGISVYIEPFTDLLSYGDADFYLNCAYGEVDDSLSASCPTGVK